jgi:hypothetical protein
MPVLMFATSEPEPDVIRYQPPLSWTDVGFGSYVCSSVCLVAFRETETGLRWTGLRSQKLKRGGFETSETRPNRGSRHINVVFRGVEWSGLKSASCVGPSMVRVRNSGHVMGSGCFETCVPAMNETWYSGTRRSVYES